MKYNQLVSSIQSNIKSVIRAEGINAPEVIPFTEIILKLKKPNNLFHSYQGKGKIIPVSETKWKNSLNINSTSITWENTYKNILSLTIDTTLRNSQYKIVMIIILTNKMLFKFQQYHQAFVLSVTLILTVLDIYFGNVLTVTIYR